jgi:hypothetical protein
VYYEPPTCPPVTVVLAVLAITVLFPVAVTAQTSAPVYFPFSFTANHQVLPAGIYKISLLSDRYLAFIYSNTGKTAKVVMVFPEEGNKIESLGGLIFQSSGHRYILREAWMTGSSMHSLLIVQPKNEPQAARNSIATTFEIAMR